MSSAALIPTSTAAGSLAPTPTGTSSMAPHGSDEVFNCKLVGPFSILVQVLVGSLGFSTLIIKRHFESPRRPWLVWSFDVSKQVIGGSLMHMSNLLVSAVIGSGAGKTQTNPCSWYVLNLTLDCTFGVLLITGYLKVFGLLAKRYNIKGLDSGHYGDPPKWRWWLKQASVFCTAMIFMKIVVVFLISTLPFLVKIGDGILKPVQLLHSPRFEIVFVMAVWPLSLNIFESWVIDQFIKRKSSHKPINSNSTGHIPLESVDDDMHDSFELSNSSTSSRTLGASIDNGAEFSIDMQDIGFDFDDDDDDDDEYDYDEYDEENQHSSGHGKYPALKQSMPSKKNQ